MSTLHAIENRYSRLAKKSCYLSCGGALNHGAPKNGEVCVDLGSGRGRDVITLYQKAGETGYVYGIDISDGMIETAQKSAQVAGVTNVEFIKSPIDTLPLESDVTDLLISNCTINHATGSSLNPLGIPGEKVGDVALNPYRQITVATSEGTIAAIAAAKEIG